MFKPSTWLAVALGVAVLLGGLLAAKMLSPRAAAPAKAGQSGFAADIVIPPKSSPAPDFRLPDQDNTPVSISSLSGRVVAITFLDSHCKQLCPIEADQLAQVQRSLGPGSTLTLLVVSVAPATDSAASARAFAAEHGWTGDWHWLMGTAAQLAPVWKDYSIAVQPSPGDIIHSTVLYLVDKKGDQRAGFAAGLTPDVVARDIRILSAEPG